MPSLSPARARRLLGAMRRQRVLVVGDVMLDEFIWGRVARISPEAPVPVVEVTGQSFHLGGAGNVAANLCALGGEVVLAGVVGADAAGARVQDSLRAAGIVPALAVAEGARPTTVKTRIVAHSQQMVRADRELAEDLKGALEEALLSCLVEHLGSCRAVLVSDYQKGVVTPRVMKLVRERARRRGIPVLVDPKVGHFPRYKGVTVVTPNQLEAEQATGIRIRDDDALAAAGQRLLALLGCAAALITRGENGLSLFEKGKKAVHIATAAREVFDVTGAGDTVIASLALALCAGARLPEAAALANYAAGVVVGKVGTATTTAEEVLAAFENRP
jgi:D-beta-D-heptose 7-phosphate kinase/D-beta-D-heptose 1-phosphate adenosyltransferase